MINTTTPTAAAEEPQVADKPATKKSPAAKKGAAKKSPAAKKGAAKKSSGARNKAAAKKTVSRSTQGKLAKKATSKAAAKTKPVKQAKPTKQKAAKPKTTKADKPKKPKLVRDGFTMPEQEYALLGQIKKACQAGGIAIKKSELLRIGVAQLAAMNLKKLKAAQAALTPLKAGRPKKSK
ncbi:hypothetical protein MCEMAEM21_00552 [Oxalobacteraceae bacterium]